MIWLLAAFFVLATLSPLVMRIVGQRGFFFFALIPLAAAIWLIVHGPAVLAGGVIVEGFEWIPTLGVGFTFRIGLLQWVLGLVVTVIGAIVLFYCRSYFAHDPPQARVAGLLVGFAGAMLGLVTSDDLIALYIFWELTTVFSYLLVGHNPLRAANRGAAMTALIVTTFGGLAMLVGILILADKAGSFSLATVLEAGLDGPLVTVAVALLLLGAITKSAQIPFHFWLPGAMAAPTPVSAYLHAAAMVKAGIYLIAVLAPVAAGNPVWRPTVLLLGAVTMIIGGWQALRQNDIKLLLAFGTVSQLGFLTVLNGLGTASAALAGLALLVSHALFKSALFLVVGVVDHSTGTRDLNELSGVGRKIPVIAVAAILAGASMAGFPPLLGFIAKESAFESVLYLITEQGDGTSILPGPAVLLMVALVLGSVLTVAYTLRFLWGAFADKSRVSGRTEVARVGPVFGSSPVVLALAGLVLGFFGPHLTRAFSGFVDLFSVGHHPHGLALWHGGFTVPLLLSLLCWILGAMMFRWRLAFARLQETFPEILTAQEAYGHVMRGLDRASVEVTARAQRGSLPIYLGTIMVVLVLFTGGVVLTSPALPDKVVWWDNIAQAMVGLVIVIAAFLAASSRGRLKAVILVGVTGFGVSVLFLLHGAPDLALTQALVETVSIVVFVLVVRKLPKYFTDRPLHSSRWWRWALSVLVGATVAGATMLAASARRAVPPSDSLTESAYRFGYGRNIVNVVLVDTRAWDTLGEISVLLAAATGVASLIFIRARFSRQTRVRRLTAPDEGQAWLRGGVTLSPQQRTVVLEVMTRLMFPVMMIVAVYLLLAGHNHPGGGFAGGLIAGMGIMIRYLAGGRHELEEAAPVDAGRVLGGGMILATLSAVWPVAIGGRILQSYEVNIHIPYLSQVPTPWGPVDLMGDIHLVTSMFFDIGVFLIVLGLMLDIARSLGSGIDVHEEEDRAPSPRSGARGSRSGRPTVTRLRRPRTFSEAP
ncbi:Na+/H+ antiporter subunit A [Enemella sp. A6]|uniref:Na+/H+ antiporter subunit A n=1 Tax=Enemella sp. A6 TaxID=3440152 RepID=UPI003EBAB7EB